MNNRERFLNILEGKEVDRMTAVHFGYWSELLQEWAEQGHISRKLAEKCRDGNHYDRMLDKMLGWDCAYTCLAGSNTSLIPSFEHKTVKIDDGGRYYLNGDGVTIFEKLGANGIPMEIDYLLKDRASYLEHYKSRFLYRKERNTNANTIKKRYELNDQYPRGFHIGSAIGTIRNICTVVGMSYLMYDDYDLFKEIVDDYNDMIYKCLKTTLESGVKIDFLHYWEDICFKNGPLISPLMFHDLCFNHYKSVSDLASEYGIKYISVECDGDISKLVKTWEETNINVMFPIEYGTWELDIKKIRNIAPTLYGVGGMNKNVLSQDKDAVDREIERLKSLVKLGGYIPCPDHRLPPGTKYELVKYYISKIKQILD